MEPIKYTILGENTLHNFIEFHRNGLIENIPIKEGMEPGATAIIDQLWEELKEIFKAIDFENFDQLWSMYSLAWIINFWTMQGEEGIRVADAIIAAFASQIMPQLKDEGAADA